MDADTMRMIYAAVPVIIIQVLLVVFAKNLVSPKINIVADWAKSHGMVTEGKLVKYKTFGMDMIGKIENNEKCRVEAYYQYQFEDGTSGVIVTDEMRPAVCRRPSETVPVYKYKDGKIYARGSKGTSLREIFFLFVLPISLWAFFYHMLG